SAESQNYTSNATHTSSLVRHPKVVPQQQWAFTHQDCNSTFISRGCELLPALRE
ncbi:unnamed protein product, partial [Mycena citricolor]